MHAAEQVPVAPKEAYVFLELDRSEVRSPSHLKRTTPGFVWKRTETTSLAGSWTCCLVRTRVRWFVFTPDQNVCTRDCFWFSSNQTARCEYVLRPTPKSLHVDRNSRRVVWPECNATWHLFLCLVWTFILILILFLNAPHYQASGSLWSPCVPLPQLPDLVNQLGVLYHMIESRVKMFHRLNKLNGKLLLLITQVGPLCKEVVRSLCVPKPET